MIKSEKCILLYRYALNAFEKYFDKKYDSTEFYLMH